MVVHVSQLQLQQKLPQNRNPAQQPPALPQMVDCVVHTVVQHIAVAHAGEQGQRLLPRHRRRQRGVDGGDQHRCRQWREHEALSVHWVLVVVAVEEEVQRDGPVRGDIGMEGQSMNGVFCWSGKGAGEM